MIYLAATSPVRLPIDGQRNVLITSALPYANNVPHLGNLIGCVLSADVYSRFLDLCGVNKIYVCGTDEYGTATETKALQLGLTEQELCDRFYKLQSEIYQWFDIGFDYFHRTTTTQQTAITQEIFLQCEKNGFIQTNSMVQLFCEHCNRFLADRYVSGICPLCKAADAKGDQCDACSQLINAVELIQPQCSICKSTPVQRPTSHLFLDLPKLQDKLKDFIDDRKKNWSDNSVRESEAWLNKGLLPRCITRDLRWGTKVPHAGFENKVFYVWFDAPIGYVSITAGYTKDTAIENKEKTSVDQPDYTITRDWEKWWKNPDNVELVQFMGKDNIPFHTVIFPSTLLASGDNWTMLNRLSTTEYLNYETGKFSKTRGTGVFGDQAKDTGIPVEVWRYYLLATRPEQNDSTFTWDQFASHANGELPNNIGNLAQRSLTFIKNKYDNIVPDITPLLTSTDNKDAEITLETKVSALLIQYISKLEDLKLRDALSIAMKIASEANTYMQTVSPWTIFKDQPILAGAQLSVIFNMLYLVAIIFEPYMPSFSKKLLAQLNLPMPSKPLEKVSTTDPNALVWNLTQSLNFENTTVNRVFFPLVTQNQDNTAYVANTTHQLGDVTHLFNKITPAQVEELRQRYRGKAEIKESVDWGLVSRICEVKSCTVHPKDPHSYIMEVAGEPKPIKNITAEDGTVITPEPVENAPQDPIIRTVIAPVVAGYTPEQLIGQKIITCCNVKKAKHMGEVYNAVALLATNVDKDGKRVQRLLTPKVQDDVVLGALCLPTNGNFISQKTFDLKKCLKALEFTIEDNGEVYAGGVPFVIQESKGVIVANDVTKGAPVSI